MEWIKNLLAKVTPQNVSSDNVAGHYRRYNGKKVWVAQFKRANNGGRKSK